MKILNINKGIRGYIIDDDKFRGCSIAVVLRLPLKRETVTRNALIVNVLGLGSKNYPSPMQLNRAAEEMFGGGLECVNVKKGDSQLLEFYAEVINKDDNIKNALYIMKEVIFNPLIENGRFRKDYTEREKTALRLSINSIKDDKREYAKTRLTEEMFSGEPFGVFGDGYAEDIEKITPETLYDGYRDIIKTAEIDIILVGNMCVENVCRYLAEFDKGERYFPEESISAKKVTETRRITEDMDITQGKLCMGVRTCADYYPLLAANEILGGGSDSRLFMNVREKEGLCYYITSSVVRCCKSLIIQAGISKKDLDKVIEIICRELREFYNVSDEEIEGAKRNIIKHYTASEDVLGSISDFCMGGILGGEVYLPKDGAEKIKNTAAADVRNVFKDTFPDTIYFLRERD